MFRADFLKAFAGLGIVISKLKKDSKWATAQDVYDTIKDYDYLSERWPHLLTHYRKHE